MREYKIKTTSLGYKIYKVKYKNDEPQILYRTGKLWSYKKERAKIYITQDMAVSALVLSKRQEGIEDFWS